MVLPICGLIRRLDAHHMRSTLALEFQRLALDRIKVRSLAGFDADHHAGGRQTVHLVAVRISMDWRLLPSTVSSRRSRFPLGTPESSGDL